MAAAHGSGPCVLGREGSTPSPPTLESEPARAPGPVASGLAVKAVAFESSALCSSAGYQPSPLGGDAGGALAGDGNPRRHLEGTHPAVHPVPKTGGGQQAVGLDTSTFLQA
jgi:hypothetical protein